MDTSSNQSYLSGFSDCVRQITDFVGDISDVSFRESLQSHLNQCLFSIQSSESANQCPPPVVSVSQSSSVLPPSPPNSSNSSSAPFSTFCTPPSPAPSAESSLSSSSSSASLSPLTLPHHHHHAQMRGLKRQFSDDEEEEPSDEEEQDCFNTSGPINLCKISKSSDATWRPW
mgnify:CR=1 FL=1